MFSLKTVFRRMIETSTKCACWTILLKLGSVIMSVILMVLIIVIASVIVSSMTTWPMKVSTVSTATSTTIITIVIIIIATTGRIKLPTVAMKLTSIVILLSSFPLLRPPVWSHVIILTPIGSTDSIIIPIILIVVIIISILLLFFLLMGRGRWLRLLLLFYFTFTFLSSMASSTLGWFRYACGVLILRLFYIRI